MAGKLPRNPRFIGLVKSIFTNRFAGGIFAAFRKFAHIYIGQQITAGGINKVVAEKFSTLFVDAFRRGSQSLVKILDGSGNIFVLQSIQIAGIFTLQEGCRNCRTILKPRSFGYFVGPEICPHLKVFAERHCGFFAHHKFQPFSDQGFFIEINVPAQFLDHINLRAAFPMSAGVQFIGVNTQIVIFIKMTELLGHIRCIVIWHHICAFKAVIPPADGGNEFIPLIQTFFKYLIQFRIYIKFEVFADNGNYILRQFDIFGHFPRHPVVEQSVKAVGIFFVDDIDRFCYPFVIALGLYTGGHFTVFGLAFIALADFSGIVD